MHQHAIPHGYLNVISNPSKSLRGFCHHRRFRVKASCLLARKKSPGLARSQTSLRFEAASGEIASRAASVPQNGNAQCTTIVVYFVPKEDKVVQEPAAKRAKKAPKVESRRSFLSLLKKSHGDEIARC